MNAITAQIEDLMDNIRAMKKTAGVDVKALNKTLARLEEAWLWSQHMVRIEPALVSNGNGTRPTVHDSTTAARATTGTCICPTGAVDRACPIHRVV